MRRALLPLIDFALLLWVILAYAMMNGVRSVFDVLDSVQAASGLGSWFPPLFLFVVPLVLVVLIGLLNGQRGKSK